MILDLKLDIFHLPPEREDLRQGHVEYFKSNPAPPRRDVHGLRSRRRVHGGALRHAAVQRARQRGGENTRDTSPGCSVGDVMVLSW